MSAKAQPKPRKMWANYYPDGDIVLHGLEPLAAPSAGPNANYRVIPVAVIPLNDTEELLRQAHCAFESENTHFESNNWHCLRAALTAIGVLPKQRKGRK